MKLLSILSLAVVATSSYTKAAETDRPGLRNRNTIEMENENNNALRHRLLQEDSLSMVSSIVETTEDMNINDEDGEAFFQLVEAATVMGMDNAFDTKSLETLLFKHGEHHWPDYDYGAKCELLREILRFVHVKPSYGKSGKSGSKHGGSGGDYDYLWKKLGYLIDYNFFGKSGKSGPKHGGSGGDYDYLWKKLGYLIDYKCKKFETTTTSTTTITSSTGTSSSTTTQSTPTSSSTTTQSTPTSSSTTTQSTPTGSTGTTTSTTTTTCGTDDGGTDCEACDPDNNQCGSTNPNKPFCCLRDNGVGNDPINVCTPAIQRCQPGVASPNTCVAACPNPMCGIGTNPPICCKTSPAGGATTFTCVDVAENCPP